jgi:molybdopterin converting factor small subunit
MRVKVGFLGILRDQMGRKSLEFELPDGARFADLLQAIAPTMQSKAAWAWDGKKGGLAPRVAVSRKNGVGRVDFDTPLTEGEELVVFPPLAGG